MKGMSEFMQDGEEIGSVGPAIFADLVSHFGLDRPNSDDEGVGYDVDKNTGDMASGGSSHPSSQRVSKRVPFSAVVAGSTFRAKCLAPTMRSAHRISVLLIASTG